MILFKKFTCVLFCVCCALLLCVGVYAGSAVNRYNDMALPYATEAAERVINEPQAVGAPSYSVPLIVTVTVIGAALFALVVGLGLIGRSRR